MKKTLILLILTGITFLGCSDNLDNSLVSTPIQTEELSKSISAEELNIIPRFEEYPKSPDSELLVRSRFSGDDLESEDGNDPLVNPQIVVSKTINGVTGGELIIDTTYVNYQGRLLYVYGEIFVQQNTFQGETEFTMILHPEEASIRFYPHMVFYEVVRVSVWYEGIDLEALGYNTNGHTDFAFFDDDGNIEMISAQQSHVNLSTMTIKVNNAQLNHFSRYGWIR